MGGRIRTDYEAVIAAAARPERRRLMGWLVESSLMASGEVLSWVNADHPGYLYPEAAGLLLALLAQEIDEGPRMPRNHAAWQIAVCQRIFEALVGHIDSQGAVGRDGVDYLFDSGIVLHGLLRLHDRLVEGIDDAALCALEAVIDRVYNGVLRGIAERRAIAPAPGESPRWSEAWGCHLLKLALPLAAYARIFGDDDGRPAASIRRLVGELSPLAVGGRFVVYKGDGRTYVHACCYAAEGLLAVDPAIDPQARPQAVVTATWLATIQRGDGSMLAWHDGERAFGPQRADIVAQSVRLWAAVDRHRFAASIARGLEHLAGLQAVCGGLRYGPESEDVNTWATIFAAQAIAWAEGDRRARWLV